DSGRDADRSEADGDWAVAYLRIVPEPFDTVLLNPPWGAQARHADRPFIDAAMDVGKVVYMFLNAPSEPFVERRIETTGSRITDRLEYRFPIPHLFSFHRQDVRTQEVLLYRVEVAKG